MHFSLSADQIAFRDAVRDLLAAQCPPPVLRAAWTAPGSTGDGVWQRLAAMGLFGALVPESAGGLGLDETHLVPVLAEVGYAAVPHPVAETAAVAAPLLAALGGREVSGDARLAEVVAGATRVAVAGPGRLVPYGHQAHLVVVLSDTQVRLVRPTASVPVSTVDGSRGMVCAELPEGGVLTDDPGLVRLTADRADLATAAQLVGLGRRMLDLTTAYVKTRQQFGVPVGSFQAVKHRLVDALLGLEFAEPAVLAAGWAVANASEETSRSVSLAVVLATEAATEMAKAAMQCHGAIGYTVEYDLHLYAKRAWALAATGRVDEHLDRIAAHLGLNAAPEQRGAPA